MEGKHGKLLLLAFLLSLALLTLFYYHARSSRTIAPAPQPRTETAPARQTVPLSTPKTSTRSEAVGRNRSATTFTPALNPAKLRDLDREEALPRLIHIPAGDRSDIFASLKRQGLPLWFSDRFLLPKQIRPGWIRLNRPLSLKEFFSEINQFPREKTRRVVMYSGDSLDDFIRQFSRQAELDPRELFEEYFRFSPYVDGGILAGYYRLPYRLSPGPAMAYLTEKSEKRFRQISRRYLGHYDPAEFRKYLIIASIIQRESWHPEEMPLISAVIHNRLAKNMKLQLDATLNYGPWSHKRITPERIRKDRSRFNTYRYRGLPPAPLGSVTPAALDAAFRPAKSDVLYFVKGKKGRHIFSRTYARHRAVIARLRQQESSAGSESNLTLPPIITEPQIGYNLPETIPIIPEINATP